MKKLLLLLILSTTLYAADEAIKKEKNAVSAPKLKKPEYLEINSVALDIARKKVEKENYFFEACNSLIEELKKQKLLNEKPKKLTEYTNEELEKILNTVKLKKDEIRKIQLKIMKVTDSFLGDKSILEDFYLDDKEEKVAKNEKNNLEDDLEGFNEYFKEYKDPKEKDEVRKKLLKSSKLKIPFSEFEKFSEESMRKLSDIFYGKISDILFAKVILDNIEGKNWEEKKLNFKKELPNVNKAIAKKDDKIAAAIKGLSKDKEKEKDKKEELAEQESPIYNKIISANLTYSFFPLYGYGSFNPYIVALNIQEMWKEKGLID